MTSVLWPQLGAPALFASPSRARIPQPPVGVATVAHPDVPLLHDASGSGDVSCPGCHGLYGAPVGGVPAYSRSNQTSCETTPVALPGSVSDVEFHAAPTEATTRRSPGA